MNSQRLLNLLNDNNLPELFEELDRLNIQDSKYTRFKQEFIGGFHSFDFWDRLKVFILQLDKPKGQDTNEDLGKEDKAKIKSSSFWSRLGDFCQKTKTEAISFAKYLTPDNIKKIQDSAKMLGKLTGYGFEGSE